MSTETALLRAIRDNPDEDTPRLMYADYLEEEGFSARAEFIRVQVECAQLPEDDPKRRALEDREHELLAGHECEWLGVSPDDMEELTEWAFERGFVNELAASPVFMRTAGTDLCATHPLRRWRVMSYANNLLADLKEAGQRGWAARLEVVDVSGWYAALGEVSGFLTSRSHLERLRELDLTGLSPLEPLPDIVQHAPFRHQLRALRCGLVGYDSGPLDVPEFISALGTNCQLEELAVPGTLLMTDAARTLLAAPALASLTDLDLSRNGIDADAADGFRAARFRLRELDLSMTAIGGTGLNRVLGCPALAELRRLHLNQCPHTAANVRALADSPFWAQAEELRMRAGTLWGGDGLEDDQVLAEIEPVSLNQLFAAPGSSNLRVLDVGGNGLRDPGVGRLCSAAWAGALTYLDLSQNYLSDEGLRELVRSGRSKNLRTLHLNYNSVYHQNSADESITDAGLRVLADCPDLANLRVLSLSGTRITAAGVEAVMNSPHFCLTALRLSQCQLRPDVIRVFADSPRTARLEVLDLRANDEITGGHLKPLAESEYLSQQTELDIRGLHGGDEVRTALRARLGRRLTG
jgi:uncharacterized protein (TIGR02996 family)